MAADEDVPLGDAARHYEQQFGDKIRQVRKGAARPPAGGPRVGSSGAGRGAVGAVIVIVIIIVRVLISVGNSSRSRQNYNSPPPVDFQKLQEQLQRDVRERPEAFGPAARRLLGLEEEVSYLFEEGDVLLPEGLCYRVAHESRGAASTPGKRLAMFLDGAARGLVGRAAKGERLGAAEAAELRAALNEALDQREFYDERYFRGLDLPPEAKAIAARRDQVVVPVDAADVRKLNRLALEAAYPCQITRAQFRGRLAPGVEIKIAQSDLEEARKRYEPAKP